TGWPAGNPVAHGFPRRTSGTPHHSTGRPVALRTAGVRSVVAASRPATACGRGRHAWAWPASGHRCRSAVAGQQPLLRSCRYWPTREAARVDGGRSVPPWVRTADAAIGRDVVAALPVRIVPCLAPGAVPESWYGRAPGRSANAAGPG